MIYVKTYGIQASGTNYTDKMVSHNFKDVFTLFNILGWKHAKFPKTFDWEGRGWTHRNKLKPIESPMLDAVTPELKQAAADNTIHYIVVSKHPYANYASNVAKKPPYKYTFVPVKDDVSTWLKRYNQLYLNWLNAHENIWQFSCLICYEDYLRDFVQPLQTMQQELQLEPKGEFTNVTKEVRANRKYGEEFTAQDWYLNQTYLRFFSRQDIRTFNENIDSRIVKAFGHTLANPDDFPLDRPPCPVLS